MNTKERREREGRGGRLAQNENRRWIGKCILGIINTLSTVSLLRCGTSIRCCDILCCNGHPAL